MRAPAPVHWAIAQTFSSLRPDSCRLFFHHDPERIARASQIRVTRAAPACGCAICRFRGHAAARNSLRQERRRPHRLPGRRPGCRLDLVFVPGFISNLELHWEDPGYSHLLRRLSAFTRLILFDKRGTGLSDRVDPRSARPRDPHGRRARGHGCGRQRPRGAARRIRGRPDVDPVRRDLSGRVRARWCSMAATRTSTPGSWARTGSADIHPRGRKRLGAAARASRSFAPESRQATSASRAGGRASSGCRRARPRRSRSPA